MALSLPTVIVGDGNYLALPLFAEHGKTSRTGPLTNVYLSVGLPRGVQEGYDLFSLVGSMIRGMLRNARLGTFHGLRYTETNPSQPQCGAYCACPVKRPPTMQIWYATTRPKTMLSNPEAIASARETL